MRRSARVAEGLLRALSVYPSCIQLGFPTLFPGNKTHNAVCSLGLPPTEPPSPLTIVILALAACILALTVTQLSLHIWQLRQQRVWPPGQLCLGEGGVPCLPADRSPSAETQLLEAPPPPPEDSCSCQFPEEERGERLSENKGRQEDLWV